MKIGYLQLLHKKGGRSPIFRHTHLIWLLVGTPTPLKNDGVKVSWDDDILNIWKNKKCPNHQPVTHTYIYIYILLVNIMLYPLFVSPLLKKTQTHAHTQLKMSLENLTIKANGPHPNAELIESCSTWVIHIHRNIPVNRYFHRPKPIFIGKSHEKSPKSHNFLGSKHIKSMIFVIRPTTFDLFQFIFLISSKKTLDARLGRPNGRFGASTWLIFPKEKPLLMGKI